ncbi:hypothetical protein OG689_12450 [Kitasatospora sp. NBC_00240]|uniref:hypothetical protein n=1 Tax=Kitasatospora sp. NBC_00240 TaxID=2903567 RepID=UPI002251E774|nr:hypothetical protein [Kitasatospora sp. NBC_00240]MCX5210093.1 hypothetical protein [Kitasatospora sp. NBC_00240]
MTVTSPPPPPSRRPGAPPASTTNCRPRSSGPAYWRWSLKFADDTPYDRTEAYDAAVRLVRGFVDTPGEAGVEELGAFVQGIRRIR